ncbi:MAG TPA: sulfite exporter TauE/SafE family protein [Candidatus Limnocylindria bacterium]|nr:sulfite exporter TauE/SafE family protein [Candidatus Limnocylindria bacterium]
MIARDRLRGLLTGVVAGVAGGLFGVGGGLVLIPLLTSFFGFTQHQAHGTSLAVMGATALAATAVYGAFAHVAWLTAAAVALASVWTARYGARFATRTSPVGLRRAFAVFIAAVALRLLWLPPAVADAPLFHGATRLGFDLLLGCAVGLVSGYMGVGGGILAVPAFTLGLGMTQQAAQGTSLAIIIVTGPAGAFEHSRHGNVVWALVPMLALGGFAGAPLASWLAQLVPHESLVRAFALFLLANAVATWVQGGRKDPSPGPLPVKGG